LNCASGVAAFPCSANGESVGNPYLIHI